jgi:hypothetical protein
LDGTKSKTNTKFRKIDLFLSSSKTVGMYLNNSAQRATYKTSLTCTGIYTTHVHAVLACWAFIPLILCVVNISNASTDGFYKLNFTPHIEHTIQPRDSEYLALMGPSK